MTCTTAWAPGKFGTYVNSGFIGMARQLVEEKPTANHAVVQAVVAFPDAAAAKKSFDEQFKNWGECQYQTITSTLKGQDQKATVGVTAEADGVATLQVTPDIGSSGVTCERALTVAGNVVVDIRSCSPDVGDTAGSSPATSPRRSTGGGNGGRRASQSANISAKPQRLVETARHGATHPGQRRRLPAPGATDLGSAATVESGPKVGGPRTWAIVAVALLAVLGVIAGATVYFTREDSSAAAAPAADPLKAGTSTTTGTDAGIASAGDTGPWAWSPRTPLHGVVADRRRVEGRRTDVLAGTGSVDRRHRVDTEPPRLLRIRPPVRCARPPIKPRAGGARRRIV